MVEVSNLGIPVADLNTEAMDHIRPSTCFLYENARVRRVEGPNESPVRLGIHSGSHPWWLQIWPFNTRRPVVQVEIKDAASNHWTALPMSTTIRGYEHSGAISPLTLPISIRLTDTAGHIVPYENAITDFSAGWTTLGEQAPAGDGP